MLYQIFDDTHYYIVRKKMRPTRLIKGLVSMLVADMGQGIYRVNQNHEASELRHLLGFT